jgi:hypothetical protein
LFHYKFLTMPNPLLLFELIYEQPSIGDLLKTYEKLLHEARQFSDENNKRERMVRYRKAKRILQKIHSIQSIYN